MRDLRTATPEQHVAAYGLAWVLGVLAEHLPSFFAAGGIVRPAASGSGASWAVLPDGTARPVVCGDVIAIPTEDGAVSGRCGLRATVDGACEGHAVESAAWLVASEAERIAWERSLIS